MRRSVLKLFVIVYFFLPLQIMGQDVGDIGCSRLKSLHQMNEDTYVADPGLLAYDVTFYYIDLEVNDTNTFIQGFSEIHAIVDSMEIGELVIELTDSLYIDSLLLNGIRENSIVHNNDIIRVALDSPLIKDQLISIRTYYHGNGGTVGFFSGISSRPDNEWDKNVTYTLSEPLHAKDWFACKQVLTDKADSVYVFITTDTSLMAGSNGLLTSLVELPGGKHRFEWKSKYPIAFYLISLSVSDYQDYSCYAHPQYAQDSILIQNFIYDAPGFLNDNREAIDDTKKLLELFSDLFTTYPFKGEKYGHCYAPMGGGMEHQTMTTLSSFNFGLVAHELGHQWFGDNVTCASWQDIWINEGFASYTEYLALEYLVSKEAAQTWMVNAHDRARTEPEGSIYIPEGEATSEWRIFSGALSYKKGAAILHMIRYELNNDSVFFRTLRNFQQEFKDSTATGMDFLGVLERTSGKEFDWFFAQWYFGQGFPQFSFTWWQNEDSLIIACSQKGSASESDVFRTRMEFLVTYVDQTDTLIQVEINEQEQQFVIVVPTFVSNVVEDPENWILDVSSTIKKPVTEGTFSVGPNPFSDHLIIEFNYTNLIRDIIITDLNGRIVKKYQTSNPVVMINTNDLVRGVFIITVKEGGESLSTKIVKE